MPNLRGRRKTDKDLLGLNLSRVKHLVLDHTSVTDDGLIAALRSAPSLEELDIICSDTITDRVIVAVAQLPRLVSLFLRTMPKITDDALRQLTACTSLHELYLESTGVSDHGLSYLRVHKSLWSLDLEGTRVTDAGFEHLASLPSLRLIVADRTLVTGRNLYLLRRERIDVYLAECPVTDSTIAGIENVDIKALDLSDTQITDKALAMISRCPSMDELRICRTNVTNAGIALLQGHPKLSWLSLAGTQVTEDAAESLRIGNPRLTINWRP